MSNYNRFHVNCYLKATCNILFCYLVCSRQLLFCSSLVTVDLSMEVTEESNNYDFLPSSDTKPAVDKAHTNTLKIKKVKIDANNKLSDNENSTDSVTCIEGGNIDIENNVDKAKDEIVIGSSDSESSSGEDNSGDELDHNKSETEEQDDKQSTLQTKKKENDSKEVEVERVLTRSLGSGITCTMILQDDNSLDVNTASEHATDDQASLVDKTNQSQAHHKNIEKDIGNKISSVKKLEIKEKESHIEDLDAVEKDIDESNIPISLTVPYILEDKQLSIEKEEIEVVLFDINDGEVANQVISKKTEVILDSNVKSSAEVHDILSEEIASTKEKQDDDVIICENIPLNPQENVHVKGLLEDNLDADKDIDLSQQIKQNWNLPDLSKQSEQDEPTDDLNQLLDTVKSSKPPKTKDNLVKPLQNTGSEESKQHSRATELVSQSAKESLSNPIEEESPSANESLGTEVNQPALSTNHDAMFSTPSIAPNHNTLSSKPSIAPNHDAVSSKPSTVFNQDIVSSKPSSSCSDKPKKEMSIKSEPLSDSIMTGRVQQKSIFDLSTSSESLPNPPQQPAPYNVGPSKKQGAPNLIRNMVDLTSSNRDDTDDEIEVLFEQKPSTVEKLRSIPATGLRFIDE